jgi:hypothetical protein
MSNIYHTRLVVVLPSHQTLTTFGSAVPGLAEDGAKKITDILKKVRL